MNSSGSLKFKGVILKIEFEATKYVPAKMYEDNGDPGSPAEGGEFIVETVLVEGVNIFDLLSESVILDIAIQYQEENDLFGENDYDDSDWDDDYDDEY